MRYPNGKSYQPSLKKATSSPNKKTVKYGKRGMKLEHLLNETNQYYLQKERAVIHKKPTPIQVVKVDYPKRSYAKITEAYYRQPSTTDYNGVYHGYYIDFEAKQTNQQSRFPLRNFHDHQLTHMAACRRQGGVTFVIILFAKNEKAFLYPYESIARDWEDFKNGGRASIPFDQVESEGYSIPLHLNPPLDYLICVDQYIRDYDYQKERM